MAVAIAPGTGELVQVIGPVIDVRFPEGALPEIYGALRVVDDAGTEVIAEVQQHVGNNSARAVAMSSTDGLRRGLAVTDLGRPITAPVGPGTLGRLFGVTGEPIDGRGPVHDLVRRDPIHRSPPRFDEQAV